jgi:hypothetical protein
MVAELASSASSSFRVCFAHLQWENFYRAEEIKRAAQQS